MNKNRLFELFFHKDSILLVIILVSLWGTITFAVPQFKTMSDLKFNEGKITNSEIVITRLKNKIFFKDTTRQMRIYLDGNNKYFILPGKGNYPEFDSLYFDDSVQVYTMDKTLGIFGFDPRLVYHMVRLNDKRIFVDLSKQQKEKSGLWVLTLAFTIIFGFLYLYKVIRRMQ